MIDKQQDLKKIYRRINQIYLMVKQLSEYVGWEGGDIPILDQTDLEEDLKLVNSLQSHSDNLSSLRDDNHSQELVFSEHYQSLNNHKDILADDDSLHHPFAGYSHSLENVNISYEEQINRLTAQLTAAYHRIACLEEQLLSARIQDKS